MADTFYMSLTKKRPKGYGASLGWDRPNTKEVMDRIGRGFAYSAILRLHRASGLSVGEIADLVQIPPRTLIRRKASGRLRPEESERLLRISNIFEKAMDLFEGDVQATRQWLNNSSEELAGQTPLDFARTEIGAREVEDFIGRLEHGVFT